MLRLLRLGVGLGVDDEDVGVGAVGDPELGPVEDVVVSVPLRAGGHGDDVRPRAGLGHGERTHVLAVAQPRQVLLLLLLGAVSAR